MKKRKDGKVLKRIAVQVDEEMLAILKKMAKDEDRSIKKTVERIIKLKVKKENGEN